MLAADYAIQKEHSPRVEDVGAFSPSSSDPLQWLWDAGEDLRERWGLPKLKTKLTPDSEF
jgi:hypothetical protein